MARPPVVVLGLVELGRSIRALGGDRLTKMARSMTNAGAQVVKATAIANAPISDKLHFYYRRSGKLKLRRGAQEKVPILPGNLRRNIMVARIKTDLTAEYIVTVRHKGKGVVGIPYAEGVFTEFGTVNQSAQPWLRPALANNISAAEKAMQQKGSVLLERDAKAVAKQNRKLKVP